jgi:hypothetical protein
MPFVKTPANILKRAIEYSPLGIEKALREARNISRGTFDQRAFVDSIGRSVTGTALIMVGYDLAQKGLITGSGDKDKDIAAFERNLGKSDFAFKVENNYYTYDWAQPASMGLAVGADIYLKGKNRKYAENVVSDAIKSGGETLFKQSLLQGIQRFMGGFNPMENVESTIVNAPSQFIPTISKQLAQVTDHTKRTAYVNNNIDTGLNLMAAKIPGLSKNLEPQIDTFGNTKKNYQHNNLLNIFINPGTHTTYKPNKVQKEIVRLYNQSGNKDIFPKVAPKSLTYKGERIELTPSEITKFQRTMGKETERKMTRVVNAPRSDSAKEKALISSIKKAYDVAKLQLVHERKKQGN